MASCANLIPPWLWNVPTRRLEQQFDQGRVGIGAGAEGIISGPWSWKVDYLHVDLGKATTAFTTLPGCYGGTLGKICFNVNPSIATITHSVTDEIVGVGINYRFGPMLRPY